MKKHPLDLLSLIFGLVFLLIAGLWTVHRTVDVDLPPAGWFVAGGLILVGLLGIGSIVRGVLRGDRTAVESEHGGADTQPPVQG
ncbi:MAG: hypothetical protein HOV71_08710 [Hamadaea sp.]|uniref:hypothetical protein n=1 Tax=Hamadaea sp. NPDC050747 TaxID=3155789 RepID=UPI001853F3BC|nr:hypothetical protein [Hamadaea sp.]NUR48198.1 hypothetical protein [Hamadaea sp.]NUT06518.1 hypothetical protein [Hamadaea sp.]